MCTGETKVEQRFGDAVGVVAEDVTLVDEVAWDGLDAEGADAVEIGLDGELALVGISCEERG